MSLSSSTSESFKRETKRPASPAGKNKRLVFCFDGTWNKLATDTPTNVVLTAASIERMTSDGIAQIMHYDEGVGTGVRDRLTGGMFGAGLDVNMREAYRFLVFNYDPGDDIFVFGFSRGAFTARTFVGLLRHVGPLRRLHVDRIDDAIALYKERLGGKASLDELRRFRADYAGGVCIDEDEDDWRCRNVEGYRAGDAPRLTVRFLGVWDTVAALGVPAAIAGSSFWNRKHRYHDMRVDGFVRSMRHAVAIDERRVLFPATRVEGLEALNRTAGFTSDDPKAPYQERWFAGVHGSVGGGGDIRGLSDGSLAWVLEGAKRAGLRLDTAHGTRIQKFRPDPLGPLQNAASWRRGLMDLWTRDRPGPTQLHEVAPSVHRRWHADPTRLAEREAYRPKTLDAVAEALASEPPIVVGSEIAPLAVEIVARGDTLSRYAQKHYGNASLWPVIFAANRDTLDDADSLFEGQQVRIPPRRAATDEEKSIGV